MSRCCVSFPLLRYSSIKLDGHIRNRALETGSPRFRSLSMRSVAESDAAVLSCLSSSSRASSRRSFSSRSSSAASLSSRTRSEPSAFKAAACLFKASDFRCKTSYSPRFPSNFMVASASRRSALAIFRCVASSAAIRRPASASASRIASSNLRTVARSAASSFLARAISLSSASRSWGVSTVDPPGPLDSAPLKSTSDRGSALTKGSFLWSRGLPSFISWSTSSLVCFDFRRFICTEISNSRSSSSTSSRLDSALRFVSLAAAARTCAFALVWCSTSAFLASASFFVAFESSVFARSSAFHSRSEHACRTFRSSVCRAAVTCTSPTNRLRSRSSRSRPSLAFCSVAVFSASFTSSPRSTPRATRLVRFRGPTRGTMAGFRARPFFKSFSTLRMLAASRFRLSVFSSSWLCSYSCRRFSFSTTFFRRSSSFTVSRLSAASSLAASAASLASLAWMRSSEASSCSRFLVSRLSSSERWALISLSSSFWWCFSSFRSRFSSSSRCCTASLRFRTIASSASFSIFT
mmetsp:Transcript_90838/g.181216  ORF Transcript_90838/g.181216 Transcript_90838/m.181216 type:complete len:522 (-) Transcript_90838:474-2039(-)